MGTFTPTAAQFNYYFSTTIGSGQTIYYTYTYFSLAPEDTIYITITHPNYGGTENDAWTGYTKPSGDMVLPNYITTPFGVSKEVRYINNYAFYGCNGLTSVSIGNNVIYVGHDAFSHCNGLQWINFQNAEEVGYFSDCESLSTIFLGGSLESLGRISNCPNIISINIPNTVRNYMGGFMNCTSLKTLVIPNQVTYFWGCEGCTSLTSVTLGNGITRIGSFDNCINLDTVNYYGTLENWCKIHFDAPFSNPLFYASKFYINNELVTHLDIPEQTDTIKSYAFYNYNTANSVTIPRTIKYFGFETFYNCISIDSVFFKADSSVRSNSNLEVGGPFDGLSNISHLYIGANVKRIPEFTFRGCSGITSIVSDNPIPPSIHFVGEFGSINTSIPIRIPCGSLSAYSSAAEWRYFSNYVEDDSISFTIKSSDTTQGSVSILVFPTCSNSIAEIEAIPHEGYQFSNWNDGNTDSHRIVTVSNGDTLIAYFTEINCDSITLPYIADFTQCWTATGGATIIDSNHASITSQGQTLTSPWIEIPAGQTYINFTVLRGNDQWQFVYDSSRYFTRKIVDTTGNIIWSESSHASSSSNVFYSYFVSDGGLVRVEITYSDPSPAWMFEVTDLHMYRYPMDMTIDAPETVHIGDTVSLLAHLTIPTGETAEWEWTFRNGLEYNDFVAAADTTMLASTDSSKTLVWNTPGTYYVNVDVHHWNPYAYVSIRHIITVLDTTTVDCDSIRLPYSADFTQCWTTSGGATIIDINHASITSQGQRLVGPWMASTEGKCFIDWSMSRIGEINYNSEQYTLTIEGEDSVITSWIEYAGNWSIGNNFTSPGGRIRVVFEYTGTSAVPTFQITDIRIFQYDIEATLEASSSIAQVGDTITFIIHSTLQNGEVPDNYSMDTYNSQGQWMYENDPDRTIVSNTDSIYKVVWNTAGRYRVYGGVHKYVDNTGWAYATSSLGIIITDHPVYAEDSIYYISAAMDTVIGCHPDLHVANLPESVTVIFDSAFFNLSNLSIIELPTSLHTIGNMAFAWNQGISEITIPQNVTFVGDNAFWWDTNLTTVNFNATNCQTMSPSTDENGNYWPVFIGCNNITTINIGENVTRIPDRAFSYCNGLHGTLTIPDAVTYIGRSAFFHWIDDWDWENGSSWDTLSIVLGTGLTEIGDYAFGCPRAHITSVISHNPEPPIIGEQTFYRYEPEYTPRLQVPCGSAAAYRNAQHWSRIEEIIEDCDGIEDAENDARTPAILSDNGIITVVGATELVSVYDMMGRLVSAYMPTDFRCTIVVPHSGVYMVKIGDCPARKIVVIK